MRKEGQIRTEMTGRERKEILMFTDLDFGMGEKGERKKEREKRQT